MIDKYLLRKKYRNIRGNILNKAEKEEMIRKKVIDLIKIKNAKVIGLYASYKDEVNTFLLINELKHMNKIIVLPRMNNDQEMNFYCYNSYDELIKNDYGILEPKKENTIIDPKSIDVVIVPGLVFDIYKNRIGYGKGYYDKYLKNTNIYKIGICFDEQIIDEEIASESFDVKMDLIISEKRVI